MDLFEKKFYKGVKTQLICFHEEFCVILGVMERQLLLLFDLFLCVYELFEGVCECCFSQIFLTSCSDMHLFSLCPRRFLLCVFWIGALLDSEQ